MVNLNTPNSRKLVGITILNVREDDFSGLDLGNQGTRPVLPATSPRICPVRQFSVAADYLPKLSEERDDRDQPSRDVLPEDRVVFIDKKIEAAGRTPSAPGSVAPDDLSIGVADERVGRVD